MAMKVNFDGKIHPSKSSACRALIVASLCGELASQRVQEILSACNDSGTDVQELAQALLKLLAGERRFSILQGGAPLRFLLGRLTREMGRFEVDAGERLRERPWQALAKAMQANGVVLSQNSNGFEILIPKHLKNPKWQITEDISTQFVSALLLAGFGLDECTVIFPKTLQSSGYLNMTQRVLEQFGAKVEAQDESKNEVSWKLTSVQTQFPRDLAFEADVSSAASLAAVATAAGSVVLREFRDSARGHPDVAFVSLLENCGKNVSWNNQDLHVNPAQSLIGQDVDFSKTPDLFPVMSVILAHASGPSTLRGLQALNAKESCRLDVMVAALRSLGLEIQVNPGMIRWANGIPRPSGPSPQVLWKCHGDHRIAMAGAVASAFGWNVKLDEPECVQKSFPRFWEFVC